MQKVMPFTKTIALLFSGGLDRVKSDYFCAKSLDICESLPRKYRLCFR